MCSCSDLPVKTPQLLRSEEINISKSDNTASCRLEAVPGVVLGRRWGTCSFKKSYYGDPYRFCPPHFICIKDQAMELILLQPTHHRLGKYMIQIHNMMTLIQYIDMLRAWHIHFCSKENQLKSSEYRKNFCNKNLEIVFGENSPYLGPGFAVWMVLWNLITLFHLFPYARYPIALCASGLLYKQYQWPYSRFEDSLYSPPFRTLLID